MRPPLKVVRTSRGFTIKDKGSQRIATLPHTHKIEAESLVREYNTDELTVAYIALGAMKAWDEASNKARDSTSDRYSGQSGYISAVISHAHELDMLAYQHEEEFSGVFAYDVAEPFGYEYGTALIRDADYSSPTIIMERLIREACAA